MLDIFQYICNGSAQDSSKLFDATFFKPEKMANIMRITRQTTFTQLRKLLSVATVLAFILLIFPVLSAVGECKVVRVADGDTINIKNNGKTSIIRLVGLEVPEISKKKNKPGQQFSQKSTKHLASLVLNKSVEIKSYGNDRYERILGVVYVDGYNANLKIVLNGLSNVDFGRQ